MAMMKNPTRWVELWLLAIVMVMAYPANAARRGEGDLSRTFEVSYGGTLTLESARGSIEVTSARAAQVTVEVTREIPIGFGGTGALAPDDFVVSFDHSGENVSIKGEFRDGRKWARGRSRLRVDYRITVPERYELNLTTAGGSIRIADLEGDVRSTTAGGNLDIGQINGSVEGRTSGGSISLDGSSGTVEVHTSGGGIRIGRVAGDLRAHTSGGAIEVEEAGGNVTVETSGGGITLRGVRGSIEASTSGGPISATLLDQPERGSTLRTSGGGVTVRLAADIGVSLDAKTSGGDVSTELPITLRGKVGRRALKGKINDGGPSLYIRSSGGSIRILSL